MTTLTTRLPAAGLRFTTAPYSVMPGRGWNNRRRPDWGAENEVAMVGDNATGNIYQIIAHDRRTLLCTCGAPMGVNPDGRAVTRCAHVHEFLLAGATGAGEGGLAWN